MWDVWFDGQIVCSKIEHLSNIDEIFIAGSGDGRIVHLAAQNGYHAHGIELNPWLVMYSKFKSLTMGLSSNATFSRQDLWKTNFEQYDNIVIFGVEQMVNYILIPYFLI